jgi:addiction module RelE/StbE family toxin
MNRIRFTRRFERNLNNILDFISQENPVSAKRVIQDIQKSIYVLADYHSVGRKGSVEGTRELIVTQYPYIVIYRVLESDDEVQVLDIVHMAQDRPRSE